MKIAEISNIREAVPPLKYGGTEYVISLVTEGLVERGHEVTLFATGDSHSRATIDSVCDKSIGFANVKEEEVRTVLDRHLSNISSKAQTFDIMHNHLLETFSLTSTIHIPIVTTLHTDLARDNEQSVLTQPNCSDTFFISISDSQRKSLPNLNYARTIYHGIPVEEFPFKQQQGEYYMFLGRITPEKGVEIAVEVAKQTKRKLIIAAKVDKPLTKYSRSMLKLFKETPYVEFIGQVGEEKKELLVNAYALLMPIQWEEPFGLVVIEALACGTPVIATKRGSMPEILEDGKTGFLVTDTDSMIEASSQIPTLDRKICRQNVEKRFSVDRMVDEYDKAFTEIVTVKK
jgi:glycosyltransferase involved in cell wall biosynthesis